MKKTISIKMNKRRAKALIFSLIRLMLLIGLAFMIMFPLFLKFVESIKSAADNIDPTVIFIPKSPVLDNYSIIIKAIDYPFTLSYSLLFVFVESIIQALTCAAVAYGFARFHFKGKTILFACTLLTLVVPPQVMLIPIYLRFRFFGISNIFQFSGSLSGINLTDTIFPFLLLSITAIAFKNGLYIYLLRQYFAGLPGELEEAAYIDGCGQIKTFFKIMLPGAIPMLVTVFLFAFVWQWNDQFYAKTLAPNIPLLITKIYNMNSTNLPAMGNAILQSLLNNAKLMLLIFPLVILYAFAQRFFTESIERSGITG
ncbi:MAG: carbohydrate ABC transporter permease [Saccharofermentanales bacterium]